MAKRYTYALIFGRTMLCEVVPQKNISRRVSPKQDAPRVSKLARVDAMPPMSSVSKSENEPAQDKR